MHGHAVTALSTLQAWDPLQQALKLGRQLKDWTVQSLAYTGISSPVQLLQHLALLCLLLIVSHTVLVMTESYR